MKKRLLSLVMALAMICGFAAWVPELKASAENSYLWPVPDSRTINQYYSSSHDGLDIGGYLNAEIVATMSGTVIAVLDGDVAGKWIGYGKGVVINHGDGYYSHYAHMNYTSVSTGQHVNQGDKLGGMGTTGNSTGVHLHFAVATSMYGAGGRINVNPDSIGYIYSIHTHSYSSSVTTEPTCTATGVRKYTCSCGDSYTETIPALGHNYVSNKIRVKMNSDGYTEHVCSRCGNSYNDNTVYKPELESDGWYHCAEVPEDIDTEKYEIQYNNSYEVIASTSPGSDWVNAGVHSDEWVNSGDPYTSLNELETSDSRVLLSYKYFHFCGPNAGAYCNYDMTGNFVHYDEVSPSSVTVEKQGWDDEGNVPYFLLNWNNGGGRVYCESGVTCDGSWGSHGKRGCAWYKQSTYQDRTRITKNKYTKTSGWTSNADPDATSVQIRFKTNHSHSYTSKVTKKATCTKAGVRTYTCSCGDSYTKTIKALGHDYVETVVKPTCSSKGYTNHKCSRCGNEYKDTETDMIAHKYGKWVETTAPTCTAKGVQTRTCSVCKTKQTKKIAALGHDYVETVVKPTCSSKGYTNHKCSRCGNEYNDTETDMIAHKYGKWVETTAPTCTAKGVQTRTCSVCKTKQTKKIAALGHDYIESVIPPTCQTKGYTLHKCSRCKDEYKDNETDKSAHSFGKWKTTTAATCTAKGAEKRTCSVCKASETREIKALGHDYVASIVPATCSSKGYTLYKCSRCNDEFKDNYTDSTGGHKWSGWKTTAFDLDKGTSTQKRTCSVCNKTESKTTKNAVVRLGGANRYETAAVISTKTFKTAETVIIATGMSYHDALVAVPLAKAYNAPLLLATEKKLTVQTKAELERLKAKNVIIVSTANSIGTQTIEALAGYNTSVISGKNCFDTAAKVAKALQEKTKKAPDTIFFATDSAFADALSASPVAAIKGAPIIYLKNTGSLDSSTADYLKSVKGKVKNAYIIGGDGVISDAMMSSVAKALGLTVNKTVQRVAGMNRYETCAAVNNKFKSVLTGDMICVATGMDFPDALAGGVYAALNKAPLFLINGKTKTPKLTDEQKAYLKTKSAGKITAFGGTGVVPDSHIADIAKNSI